MTRTLPVAIAILAFTAGCTGSDGPKDSAGDATTSAMTLIDYGDGVDVVRDADVSKLTGAPEDFKAFIVAELARKAAAKDEACTEKPLMHVNRVDTRGWAEGGVLVPECGGYATLWAKDSGEWREVWGGQTIVECTVLDRYRFPVELVGNQCVTDDQKARRYPA